MPPLSWRRLPSRLTFLEWWIKLSAKMSGTLSSQRGGTTLLTGVQQEQLI